MNSSTTSNSPEPEQTFSPRAYLTWMMGFCALGFFCFAALGASLPFIEQPHENQALAAVDDRMLSFISLSLFIPLGAFCIAVMRRIPGSSVTVDGDGIWPSRVERSRGLIRWSEVANLRQRLFPGGIELSNLRGEVLLRADDHLAHFAELRTIILDRCQSLPGLPTMPVTVSPSAACQIGLSAGLPLVSGGAMIAIAVTLKVPSALTGLFLVILVAGSIFDHLRRIRKIVVRADRIEVHYPLAEKPIFFDEIIEILIAFPAVTIATAIEHKPLRLLLVGTDTMWLYRVLALAKRDWELHGRFVGGIQRRAPPYQDLQR